MTDTTPAVAAAAAAAAAAATPPDVRTVMHAATCPDCHLPFAFPLAMFLERLEACGHVYCPAGHPIELHDPDAAAVGLIGQHAAMLARLVSARNACAELRAELSRRPLPPAGPVDPEELTRRVRLAAERLERVEFGRVLCRFCGKKIAGSDYNVRQHLKRRHADEIAEMAPAEFV